MNSLISSDIFDNLIHYLKMRSIINLSQTTKEFSNILLDAINTNITQCGTIIEYIALVSEKKYTEFSHIFADNCVLQALKLIHKCPKDIKDFPVLGERDSLVILINLLKFDRIDVIEKYFPDVPEKNLNLKLVRMVNECFLTTKGKEYIKKIFFNHINDVNFDINDFFKYTHFIDIPELAKEIQELYPNVSFEKMTTPLEKFILFENSNEFNPNSMYTLFSIERRLCYHLEIFHFDWLLQTLPSRQHPNINSMLINMFDVIRDDVFDQILIDKYIPLLNNINLTDAFVSLSLPRFKKLMKFSEPKPSDDIGNSSIAIMKLYLSFYPEMVDSLFISIIGCFDYKYNRSGGIHREIINEFEKKSYFIMNNYKCDYQNILNHLRFLSIKVWPIFLRIIASFHEHKDSWNEIRLIFNNVKHFQ